METKEIRIDLDVYERLNSVRRAHESLSQTLRRLVPAPVDIDALFERMATDPLAPEAVAAVEQQIAERRAPRNVDGPPAAGEGDVPA
jgi:predicted CopG family antitoxin